MNTADKRAAALKARRAQPTEGISTPTGNSTEAARAHFVGASVVEALTQGRTVQALPINHVAPELRPELRQPRLLPLPEELYRNGIWNTEEQPLIDELLTLGASMRERQIQPIIVTPGVSERYPTAQYVIVVGHRRWTAAHLVALPTIDAVVIEPPSPEDLLTIQFSENEERADFCDMERAWAIARMRRLLPDAPWETIEARFQISETRRKQLMRLTTFAPNQQQTIARLRTSEFQLRPLHTAMRAGTLNATQADQIFTQLRDRTTPCDQAAVSRLVTRAQKAATLGTNPRPRWVTPFQQHLRQARTDLERVVSHLSDLDPATRTEIQAEVTALLIALEPIVESLRYDRE